MSVKGGCLQKTAICFLCPFLCEATVFMGKISTDVTVSTAFYPLAVNASTLAHTKSSRFFFFFLIHPRFLVLANQLCSNRMERKGSDCCCWITQSEWLIDWLMCKHAKVIWTSTSLSAYDFEKWWLLSVVVVVLGLVVLVAVVRVVEVVVVVVVVVLIQLG